MTLLLYFPTAFGDILPQKLLFHEKRGLKCELNSNYEACPFERGPNGRNGFSETFTPPYHQGLLDIYDDDIYALPCKRQRIFAHSTIFSALFAAQILPVTARQIFSELRRTRHKY